jgi:uncharacterized tellurite resistance protein B-like protein
MIPTLTPDQHKAIIQAPLPESFIKLRLMQIENEAKRLRKTLNIKEPLKLTPDQHEAIIQALEYFEDREDADHDGERFVANIEMHLASNIREAFAAMLAENERTLRELCK